MVLAIFSSILMKMFIYDRCAYEFWQLLIHFFDLILKTNNYQIFKKFQQSKSAYLIITICHDYNYLDL